MLPYAFRILGPTWERRRLVDAGAAFRGYGECNPQAELGREAYLMRVCFGADFRHLLESTASTAGFTGACWAPWVWFDIDRPDNHDTALLDVRRLTAFILARYQTLNDDDLLAFYSGSKGFHLGLPTSVWCPAPAVEFHRVARRFAEWIAEQAGVVIDAGVYDRVRAFRAPNSRHPKTGRHKRRLSHAELMGLSLDAILQLAERPEPFDPPTPAGRDKQAAADWLDTVRLVEQVAAARGKRQAESNGKPTLNRLTLDFIRDGADQGDRHRLLVFGRRQPRRVRLSAGAGPCPADRGRHSIPGCHRRTFAGKSSAGLPTERGPAMADARFVCAADALAGWRDDVLSGKPPVLFPIGTGELARVRDRAGPSDAAWRGAGGRQDRIHDAMPGRCLAADADASGCGLQRRDAAGRAARPPACPAVGHRLADRFAIASWAANTPTASTRQCHTLEPLAERLAFCRPPFDLANVAATADAFDAGLILLDYIQAHPAAGRARGPARRR